MRRPMAGWPGLCRVRCTGMTSLLRGPGSACANRPPAALRSCFTLENRQLESLPRHEQTGPRAGFASLPRRFFVRRQACPCTAGVEPARSPPRELHNHGHWQKTFSREIGQSITSAVACCSRWRRPSWLARARPARRCSARTSSLGGAGATRNAGQWAVVTRSAWRRKCSSALMHVFVFPLLAHSRGFDLWRSASPCTTTNSVLRRLHRAPHRGRARAKEGPSSPGTRHTKTHAQAGC